MSGKVQLNSVGGEHSIDTSETFMPGPQGGKASMNIKEHLAILLN
jgi:hypothetical protein